MSEAKDLKELVVREGPVSELSADDALPRAIKSIRPGIYRELKCTPSQARYVVKQLEKAGEIKRKSFEVRAVKGNPSVALVINNKGARKRHHRFHKLETKEVVVYIRSKPHYEHKHAEISQKFFNVISSPRETPQYYYPVLHACLKAREIIAKEENGKFVPKRLPDGTIVYTFKK